MQLTGLVLYKARLDGFHFLDSRIEGVIFFITTMRESAFYRIKIHGCTFQAIDFRGARFDECLIFGLEVLDDCKWEQAGFRKTDVSAFNFSQDQLDNIFCDGSVKLPKERNGIELERPAHWPQGELDMIEFISQWKKWRRAPEAYVPPPPIEEA